MNVICLLWLFCQYSVSTPSCYASSLLHVFFILFYFLIYFTPLVLFCPYLTAKSAGMSAEWRVLVVDSLSMKMVSACTKMHELSAEGITSTEHVFIYRYTECMFSCGDNREEKRTNACNGGHLLDRIYRGLSEVSPTGLLQSEQNYLQGSSCILHWRWAGIM